MCAVVVRARKSGESPVELPGFLYGFYERQLLRSLKQDRIPRHIGVMVDGNRRWARQFNAPTSQGHQAGADKIPADLELALCVAQTGQGAMALIMLAGVSTCGWLFFRRRR